MSLNKFLIFFLLCSCSSTQTTTYNIELNNTDSRIDSRLVINVEYLKPDIVKVTSQIFPKNSAEIESYKLVYDMKFRENYNDEFNGVCIGPKWKEFGPGEFTHILSSNNNFKKEISGTLTPNEGDRCKNYYYYLRFFEITMVSNETYLIGVATDYAEEYPDAPNVWLRNKKGEIEKIGTTNINKYSLNFELSK